MKKKIVAAVLTVAVMALGGCGAVVEGSGGSAAESISAENEEYVESGSGEGDESESLTSVDGDSAESQSSGDVALTTREGIGDAPELPGHTCESRLNLQYAEQFDVYYYDGGYKIFTVGDSEVYLIVPEGDETPDGLSEDITVIQEPLDHIYMAASGSMCFFSALDCLDSVTLTAIDKDDWTISEPVEALESGAMTFAGKYNEPDYEMLVDKECNLAIESTMILHAPEVQEMLEGLGIPVLIDRCSYETDPFGRMEWVKFYGALMGKEQEAADYFDSELESLGDYQDYEDTGKTVAFFAINSDGQVTVRKTDDFIPNLISMAGGEYVFDDLENPDSNSASVDLTMEEFYADAKDADYLVYNATIESPLESVSDLIEKSSLFADFKAVKEGNVWQVNKSWYQSTDRVGFLLTDFHEMLNSGDADKMTFLTHVD
ncbi:MAG: ABC transporter substrate-binding protein [Eubacteriales bacterium]